MPVMEGGYTIAAANAIGSATGKRKTPANSLQQIDISGWATFVWGGGGWCIESPDPASTRSSRRHRRLRVGVGASTGRNGYSSSRFESTRFFLDGFYVKSIIDKFPISGFLCIQTRTHATYTWELETWLKVIILDYKMDIYIYKCVCVCVRYQRE